MKKLLGVLVSVAVIAGIFALASPAPASSDNFPPNCRHFCGSPEPGSECPPCQYWNPCSPNCGCKAIPGCKV
jgi:hypothetical protein